MGSALHPCRCGGVKLLLLGLVLFKYKESSRSSSPVSNGENVPTHSKATAWFHLRLWKSPLSYPHSLTCRHSSVVADEKAHPFLWRKQMFHPQSGAGLSTAFARRCSTRHVAVFAQSQRGKLAL
jgi:hypothetical protein